MKSNGPGKKKFEKLMPGERKAVRKSGAMKEAKKHGVITEIYSGLAGGRMITDPMLKGSGIRKGTQAGAITDYYRTPEKRVKGSTGQRRTTGGYDSYTENPKMQAQEKIAKLNQSEFEKTRLGSRLVRKATKSAAKQGKEVKRYTGSILETAGKRNKYGRKQ